MEYSVPPPPPDQVYISTTPEIPGMRIVKSLGIVFGQTVRTRGALGRFVAGIEAIVGGKSEAYLSEIEKARMEALENLIRKATSIGANGVVGVDFETAEILEGFIVITAVGTAVKVE
ncbi:MAG: YbjQ family protein [Crenarchaeota archaeon]|nr:YbjQ family protein [Thermoproteota archaeon]